MGIQTSCVWGNLGNVDDTNTHVERRIYIHVMKRKMNYTYINRLVNEWKDRLHVFGEIWEMLTIPNSVPIPARKDVPHGEVCKRSSGKGPSHYCPPHPLNDLSCVCVCVCVFVCGEEMVKMRKRDKSLLLIRSTPLSLCVCVRGVERREGEKTEGEREGCA